MNRLDELKKQAVPLDDVAIEIDPEKGSLYHFVFSIIKSNFLLC